MPLHEYIQQIYLQVKDPSYVIRLFDYIISSRYHRTVFMIGPYSVTPLITGVLENTKTKQNYYSLVEFYNSVASRPLKETDLEIFKHINVTNNYSLWRVFCSLTNEDILGFFDQKYRAFLLFRDMRKLIKIRNHSEREMQIYWNEQEYDLYLNRVVCKFTQDQHAVFELLEAFERGDMTGLYYLHNNKKYLISDS